MELIRLSVIGVLISSICGFSAYADLNSPFSSSISGVNIRNAHVVSKHSDSFVIRGQAPKISEIDELLDFGIERVLIFKSQTNGEVTKEITELKKKGFRSQDILQVDMPWKDITNFQDVCEMTLKSMQFLEESTRTKRSVFFHCTVGEDRTGYLAGLWGLWIGQFRDVNRAFKEEMCDRGYEAGNHQKPYVVVNAVRANLTPTFVKMVNLLADARMKGLKLNQIKCPKQIEFTQKIPTCR